jgi:hypothetical protein
MNSAAFDATFALVALLAVGGGGIAPSRAVHALLAIRPSVLLLAACVTRISSCLGSVLPSRARQTLAPVFGVVRAGRARGAGLGVGAGCGCARGTGSAELYARLAGRQVVARGAGGWGGGGLDAHEAATDHLRQAGRVSDSESFMYQTDCLGD